MKEETFHDVDCPDKFNNVTFNEQVHNRKKKKKRTKIEQLRHDMSPNPDLTTYKGSPSRTTKEIMVIQKSPKSYNQNTTTEIVDKVSTIKCLKINVNPRKYKNKDWKNKNSCEAWGSFLKEYLISVVDELMASDVQLRNGLPLDYLSYMGRVYKNCKPKKKSRKKFIKQLDYLTEHVLKNISSDYGTVLVDEAVDNFLETRETRSRSRSLKTESTTPVPSKRKISRTKLQINGVEDVSVSSIKLEPTTGPSNIQNNNNDSMMSIDESETSLNLPHDINGESNMSVDEEHGEQIISLLDPVTISSPLSSPSKISQNGIHSTENLSITTTTTTTTMSNHMVLESIPVLLPTANNIFEEQSPKTLPKSKPITPKKLMMMMPQKEFVITQRCEEPVVVTQESDTTPLLSSDYLSNIPTDCLITSLPTTPSRQFPSCSDPFTSEISHEAVVEKPKTSRKKGRKSTVCFNGPDLNPTVETNTISTRRKSVRIEQAKKTNYEEQYFLEFVSSPETSSKKTSNISRSSKFPSTSVSSTDASEMETEELNETVGQSSRHTPSRRVRGLKNGESFSSRSSICITPKAKKIINKSIIDNSPRFTPKLSNADVMNSPNAESCLTLASRLKFRKPLSPAAVKVKVGKEKRVNETRKIKKPRKGNRQGIDKTLKNAPLVLPTFSVTKEVAKIPADVDCIFPWNERNSERIEMLTNEITKDFPRWFTYLKEGFNIMLHGYGSKESIFESFSSFLGNKYLIVSINGLFKNLNARKFLGNFVNAIDDTIEIRSLGSNITFIVEKVAQKLSERNHHPVFILVSNFDVLALRHPNMLTCLCGLATVPYVHIVASSDHVNSGLGINPHQATQLNFTWFDCTTFLPYQNELIWNPSTFGEISDMNTAKNSLEHIFKSITANAKKAFSCLANLQLQKMKKQKKNKDFEGIEFRELSRVCKEAFIAHSDLALRTLLTEFIDHKLIRYSSKANKHDDNFLIIELDEESLQEYAEN